MDYHIEDRTSKTGWPVKNLVFQLDGLDIDSVKTIQNCLGQSFLILSELKQTLDNEHYFTIEVKVGEQLLLSEKTLWSVIFDACGNDYQFLINHINQWCDTLDSEEYETLPRTDEYHFIGENAFKLFFERYFDDELSITKQSEDLYRCFIRFIKVCDLDHETHQDELIHAVLGKLKLTNKSLFCELFCYRLMNGQRTYMEMSHRDIYRYLHPAPDNSLFKLVLDYFISLKNDTRFALYPDDGQVVWHLAAAIYGNNQAQINEVVAYVEQNLGFNFAPVNDRLFRHIQRVMDECDATFNNRRESKTKYSTGLHFYDGESKKWLNI